MIEIIRIHEAGHAVIAHLLGVKIEECIATITQGKTATKTYQPLMEANDYKNRILILLWWCGCRANNIRKIQSRKRGK